VAGLDSIAALVTASAELAVVRLIRGAISSGGPAGGVGGTGVGPILPQDGRINPRFVHDPEPRINPRKVIDPTPRFEPRPVLHFAARDTAVEALSAPAHPESPRIHPGPLEPPWKVLPWENPPQPAPLLKVVQKPPDVIRRGTILDVFI